MLRRFHCLALPCLALHGLGCLPVRPRRARRLPRLRPLWLPPPLATSKYGVARPFAAHMGGQQGFFPSCCCVRVSIQYVLGRGLLRASRPSKMHPGKLLGRCSLPLVASLQSRRCSSHRTKEGHRDGNGPLHRSEGLPPPLDWAGAVPWTVLLRSVRGIVQGHQWQESVEEICALLIGTAPNTSNPRSQCAGRANSMPLPICQGPSFDNQPYRPSPKVEIHGGLVSSSLVIRSGRRIRLSLAPRGRVSEADAGEGALPHPKVWLSAALPKRGSAGGERHTERRTRTGVTPDFTGVLGPSPEMQRSAFGGGGGGGADVRGRGEKRTGSPTLHLFPPPLSLSALPLSLFELEPPP